MPHFMFLKDKKLDPLDERYFRSALHLVEAKDILDRGEISHGISVLYDALSYAMQWYVLKNYQKEIYDEHELVKILKENGDIDSHFDFQKWETIMEDALDQDYSDYDPSNMWDECSKVIMGLGIPFDSGIFEKVKELGNS